MLRIIHTLRRVIEQPSRLMPFSLDGRRWPKADEGGAAGTAPTK